MCGSRARRKSPATVDSAPMRIVTSNMMTLNAGMAMISLPPTISGQSIEVHAASAVPAAVPVKAPVRVKMRTGDSLVPIASSSSWRGVGE